MSLFRAIYFSRASDRMTYSIIADILAKAETNNRRDGITGMLAYGHGWFLQTIEGERSALSNLLGRLHRDDRHSDLQLVEWCEPSEREFDRWTMRCFNIELSRPKPNPLIRKYSSTLEFNPSQMNAGQCLGLLMALGEE